MSRIHLRSSLRSLLSALGVLLLVLGVPPADSAAQIITGPGGGVGGTGAGPGARPGKPIKHPSLAPTLVTTSPLDGEAAVSLSRETILSFDQVLDPSTVNATSVYAVAPGKYLPAMLKLSVDGRRITLFYNDPLPASAVVRVTVEGDLLRGVSGFKADADGDGKPGGTKVFEFSTVSISPLTGTAVCGRVFASELATDGSGNSVNVPLQGALVTVDGAEDTLFALTDANGDFRLDPCPAGKFFVHVDGTVATAPVPPPGSYYPKVGKAWDPTPGQESVIGEIYLPLVPAGTLQPVSTTQDAVIGFAPSVLASYPEFAACHITVPAGGLFSDNGDPGLAAGIAPVPPDRLPGPLPEQLDMGVVITVQTDGASNFDMPAPVVFPNVAPPSTGRLPLPGEKLALWSFNHDSGDWELDGPATVSADGLTVASDPGFGIKAPGWHGLSPCPNQGMAPPARKPCFDSTDDCYVPILSALVGCLEAVTKTSAISNCVLTAESTYATHLTAVSSFLAGSITYSSLAQTSAIEVGKTLLQCLPIFNPYAKAVSVGLCIYDLGNSLAMCYIAAHFCDDITADGGTSNTTAADLQNAADKLILHGQRVLAIVSPMVTVFGTPLWFQGTDTPGQGEVLAMWADLWADFAMESSEDGVRLSPAETATLLATPYPEQISAAGVSLFVERWNRSLDYWQAGIFGVSQVPSGQSTDFIDLNVLVAANDAAIAAISANASEGFLTLTAGAEHQLDSTWTLLAAATTKAASNEMDWMLKEIGTGTPVPQQRGKSSGGAGARRCCSGGGGGGSGSDVDAWCYQVLDPLTLNVSTVFFDTEGAGTSTELLPPILLPSIAPDTDGDGLHDDAEEIVGTLPNVFDTDGDGIGDGAELQNGTNPLDGLAAATGIIAIVDTQGAARDVEALNDIAVVADGDGGVLVFNVFNGMDPILIASVPTPGPALDVAIDGNLIAVAMGTTGLAIIDVSDPITASIVTTIGTSALGGPANRVVAAAGVAYVAGSPGRVMAVDLALGQVFDSAFTGATALDLALDGDVLWAVTSNSLVSVPLLDGLLDVGGTVALGPVSLTEDTPRLFVGGGIATVTHGKGYSTFDITDPGQPHIIAPWFVLLQAWRDYAADGSGLAVACVGPTSGLTDLLVLDAQNPSQLGVEVGLYETPGPARDVAIYNGFAYVADDTSGLETINYQSFDAFGIPPTAAFTANISGTNVQEQQLVLLRAAVTDDVVVRNVEFWADGERLVTDGNFPFETFAHAQDLDNDGLFSVYVVARDTGGNSTTSATQSWPVVQDTHGPQVISAIPAQSTSVFAFYLVQQGATFVFEEPLDTDTDLNTAVGVVSAGADGQFGTGDDASVAHAAGFVSQGRRLVVKVVAPPQGPMRFVLDDLYLQDLAGNLLDGDGNGSPGGDFTLQVAVNASPSKAWDSPNSGPWTAGRNWTDDAAPVGSDLVVIDVPTAITVDLPSGNASFLKLTCAEDFLLNGGTLTPGFDANFLGNYTQTAGTLQGVVPTFLEGTGSWYGGVMTQLGPTVVDGSLLIDGGGDKSLVGGRGLDVRGTVTLGRAFTSFTLGGGGRINVIPGGVLDAQGDGSLSWTGTPTSVVSNSGTLRRSSSPGTFTFEAPVTSNGTIEVTSGKLLLTGAKLGGTAQLDAGTELRFNGASHLLEGFSSIGAGSLRLDNLAVDGEATVLKSHLTGFLSGPAKLKVTDTLSLLGGGTLNANALVRIEGHLAVDGGTTDKSVFGQIENTGTITFGNNLSFYGNALLTNLPGGVLDLDNDNTVGPNGGTPTSVNQGLMHKTAGTGTQTWALPLTNTGTIHVSTGTLRLSNGTVGGSVLLDAGTELQLGTGTFSSGMTATGPGVLRLNEAVVNGDVFAENSKITGGNGVLGTGTVHATGTLSFQGGPLSANAKLFIEPGALLNFVENGQSKNILGHIDNKGLATFGDQVAFSGNGSLTNFPGAMLDLVNNNEVGGNAITLCTNQGVLRKSAGTGTQFWTCALTTSGTVRVQSGLLFLLGPVTVTGGSLELAGGNLQIGGNLAIPANAAVTGAGSITTALLSTSGTTAPGLAGPGTLSTSAGWTQTAPGTLQIQLGGTVAGSGYDRLAVGGTATLGGTLAVSLVSNFNPSLGTIFDVLTFGARVGDFAAYTGLSLGHFKKLQPSFSGSALTLTVVPDP